MMRIVLLLLLSICLGQNLQAQTGPWNVFFTKFFVNKSLLRFTNHLRGKDIILFHINENSLQKKLDMRWATQNIKVKLPSSSCGIFFDTLQKYTVLVALKNNITFSYSCCEAWDIEGNEVTDKNDDKVDSIYHSARIMFGYEWRGKKQQTITIFILPNISLLNQSYVFIEEKDIMQVEIKIDLFTNKYFPRIFLQLPFSRGLYTINMDKAFALSSESIYLNERCHLIIDDFKKVERNPSFKNTKLLFYRK